MINSPTLSVLPSAPKVAKAPAVPASTGGQQSFSSAFEVANQAAQDKIPAERESINNSSNQTPNQAQSDQEKALSQVNGREQSSKAVSSDEVVQKSKAEETSEHELETGGDGTLTEKSETSVATAKESNKENIDGQESGNSLQVDGQNFAVDQTTVNTVSDQSMVDESEGSEDVVMEQVDVSVEVVSSDIDASIEASEVMSDNSTAATSDVNTETEVSEEPLSNEAAAIGGEISLDSSTVTENVELATNVESETDVSVADETLENITVSVDAKSDSTLNATTGASAASDTALAGDVDALNTANDTAAVKSEQSDVSIQSEVDSLAVQNIRPAESVAQNSTSGELNDVDNKASDNLRWVMEQMSKKTEQAGNNTLNQAAPANSEFNETEFLGALTDGELVLDSGKIELPKDVSEMLGGKKTLDQLMANLGSQLQSAAAQSQNLAQPQSVLSAVTNNLGSARPDGAAAQLTMQSLPNAAAFPSEMATKVSWIAKEGFKTAHIHLDPPELGSLTVKISVDHDANAHVSFVASSAQAKEALEGQMQRLREMLQQQGVELDSVDVEVSQGNGQAFGSSQSDENAGQDGRGAGLGAGDGLLDGDDENVSYVSPAEQGIDYYA